VIAAIRDPAGRRSGDPAIRAGEPAIREPAIRRARLSVTALT